jgi:hypothetical protein
MTDPHRPVVPEWNDEPYDAEQDDGNPALIEAMRNAEREYRAMTREQYDVAEPGQPHDHTTNPPPDQPACPHCGGGPILPALGAHICKSCARVIGRQP